MRYPSIPPEDGETDNFTDTDPWFTQEVKRTRTLLQNGATVERSAAKYARIRFASSIKSGAELCLIGVWVLALLCCGNDHAIFLLFYSIAGVVGVWLAAAAWLWVERRTL